MVKSQYPGIYPILAERLLELVSKLWLNYQLLRLLL
jgi:hypothetical protein